MKRVEDITLKAINHVSSEQWRKCISHTIKTEEEFRGEDRAQPHLFEHFVINLTSDESGEEDYSGDENVLE